MLMAWISNLSVQACVVPLCVGSCAPVDRCDVHVQYIHVAGKFDRMLAPSTDCRRCVVVILVVVAAAVTSQS